MDVRKPTDVVTWFSSQSGMAKIEGFDSAGSPLIWTGSELWVASAPGKATSLGPLVPRDEPQASGVPIHGSVAALSDGHGTWISATTGIYLDANGTVTKVSNQIVQVAGPCI